MTHYQLLGISPDAEQAGIKPAYFAALRKYPPEQYPQEFQEVRHAYEVLSDVSTRAQYDATLQMTQAEHAVYQRAKTHYDHGKLVEAIRVLTEGGAPTAEPALALLGDCYAENGNAQKAAKIFEALTVRNPANVDFLVRLGECYADRGWEKKAEAVLRRALAADEGAEQGWLALVHLSDPRQPGTQALIDDALAACNRHDRPTLMLLNYALVIAIIKESPKITDYIAQVTEQKSKSFYNDEVWRQFGEETAPFLMHYFLGWLQAEEPVDFVPLKTALEQAFLFLTEDTCRGTFEDFQNVGTIFALKIDEKVSEFMVELLSAAGLENTTALETTNLELYCLLNLETHRSEIQYIKRAYPSAYAWKKSFLDNMLQTTNTEKLMEQYSAKMTRLVKQNAEEAQALFEDFDLREKEVPFVRTEPKVGRNDPCPCGSGKKYKKCCGK